MEMYCMRLIADGIGEASTYYFESDMSAAEVEQYFIKIFADFQTSRNIYKSIDTILANVEEGKTLKRIEPMSFSYYW